MTKAEFFEGMGAVVAFMFMTALVWAMVGFYGVSEEIGRAHV